VLESIVFYNIYAVNITTCAADPFYTPQTPFFTVILQHFAYVMLYQLPIYLQIYTFLVLLMVIQENSCGETL